MTDEPSINWDSTDQLQVLTFELNGEIFAVEAGIVREILDHTPETAVPGSAPLVGSVINFRGSVIPFADLHMAFDMPCGDTTNDSRIIVIEFEMEGTACLVGLRADKVHEVTTLERASAEAAPRIGMKWRQDFIRCLAKRNGDFIVVPDLERIFVLGCNATKSATIVSFTKH